MKKKKSTQQKTVLIGIVIIAFAIIVSVYILSGGLRVQPKEKIKVLEISSIGHIYGVPGYTDCYRGKTNYLSVIVKNIGKTSISFKDIYFCDKPPTINRTYSGCPSSLYGVCPGMYVKFVSLEPNEEYNFAILLPDGVLENVCGKTWDIYLWGRQTETSDFEIFDYNSILIECPTPGEIIGNVELSLTEKDIIGYIGESIVTEIKIHNYQEKTDTFAITIWPPYWAGISATLEKSSVKIEANSIETIKLYFSIPITAEELILNFNITVKSITDEKISDSQILSLRVVRPQIEVTDIYCTEGTPDIVTLTIKNSGTTTINSITVTQISPSDDTASNWYGTLEPGKIITYTDTCTGTGIRSCSYILTPRQNEFTVGKAVTATTYCS